MKHIFFPTCGLLNLLQSTARKSTGGGLSARIPGRQEPPPAPTIERCVCEDCNYVCYTAIHLSKHAAVHTKSEKSDTKETEDAPMFWCSQCSFSTAKRSELRSHLLRGHPGRHVLRTYRCPYCTFESLDGPSTEDHVDQLHPGQKCVFEVNRDVLIHVDQPPTCLLCEEKFALACLLKSHVLEVHGREALEQHKSVALEDDYSFPEYAVTKQSSQVPTSHGNGEHNSRAESQLQAAAPPIANIAKFHCDFCEFDTNDFPLFDKHMMNAHGDEVAKEHREMHPTPPAPDSSDAPLSPPPTPASFEGSDVDSRPHKCPHCPYSAHTHKSLWSHTKNHER